VENLVTLFGQFEESNEVNNTNGILIVAGLSFFDQLTLDFVQSALSVFAATTPQNVYLWLEAILTGDTDNPALLAANVILSLIPVLGALPDLATLATDKSIWIKALSIIGIIGSIGDIVALIPGLQAGAVSSFFGDVAATLLKTLFKRADTLNTGYKAVVNALDLKGAFKIATELIETTVKPILNALHGNLDQVTSALEGVLTGGNKLWDSFKFFAGRVGKDTLLKLGFDEGSALVGRILNLGVDLSDEALIPAKNIADDFVDASIELSDDAAKGTGELIDVTKDEGKVRSYLSGAGCLLNATSSIPTGGPRKVAAPVANSPLASSINCEIAGKFIHRLGLNVDNLSNDTLEQVGKMLNKYDEVFSEALLRDLYQSVDGKFNDQVNVLIKRLLDDPQLARLVDPSLAPPAVRDGTISLLRKVSHPNTFAWGKPGLDFQLSRTKFHFYDENLSAVERYERIDNEQMFLDLVLRDGTPLEVKYWRKSTIETKGPVIVDQISDRLLGHQKVILEFGTTKTNPLLGSGDQAITALIAEFAREGIIATTNLNNTSARVLIKVIP
jgi:hypothetical protein